MLFLNDPAREAGDTNTTVDADNGRIETRVATVTPDIACRNSACHQPDSIALWYLKPIGQLTVVRHQRTTAAKPLPERREVTDKQVG